MTDIRKSAKESGKKAKKLQVNKETIADLNVKEGRGANVKGGAQGRPPQICTYNYSGCDGGE